jgi:hypothetical protein
MALDVSQGYLPVFQICLQTLCLIGTGRFAAARGLFDPVPTCHTLNRFVVVVCLPALQFWLLAIKTDLRNMEVSSQAPVSTMRSQPCGPVC